MPWGLAAEINWGNQMKIVKPIFIACLVFAIAVVSDVANAAWRDVDESKIRISFQPPYMDGWTPGKYVSVTVPAGGQADWLCWRDFSYKEANACLSYQTTNNSRGFNTQTSGFKGMTSFFKNDFKDIYPIKDGEKLEVDAPLGKASVYRFHYANKGEAEKSCLIFHVDLRTRKKHLYGWYCAPVDVEITDDVIHKTMSTIGIKGKHKPAYVSYPSLPSSTSTVTNSDDNLEKRTDNSVCAQAITNASSGQSFVWDTRSFPLKFVQEAKRRKLTPESCAVILGRTIAIDAEPTSTTSETTIEQRIKKLNQLLKSGLITEEEAAEKRKAILDEI
jgi:hypothetical protein